MVEVESEAGEVGLDPQEEGSVHLLTLQILKLPLLFIQLLKRPLSQVLEFLLLSVESLHLQ